MTFSEMYAATLPIIATENLIMGVTLLLIYGKKGCKKPEYKLGIRLIGGAMLLISVINFVELAVAGINDEPYRALSITLFAASIELFLFLFAYIALMDIQYITRRRIITELLCICLFTLPSVLVSDNTDGTLFHLLFHIALGFYFTKYVINIIIYLKIYRRVRANLQDYHSDGDRKILNWVRNTFCAVWILGTISVIVPLTNYFVLVLYQVSIFCIYFYIYWEVIQHEFIFNDISQIVTPEKESVPDRLEVEKESTSPSPQILIAFEQWIIERHYAKPGVTIEDVATQLKTNRTTLSLYLNSELKMNFYEWMSAIRIEDAKKVLIENPTLPIVEVAAYVGIEDRSNFDKLFKRIVGISPASYRIQHAQKNLNNEGSKNSR